MTERRRRLSETEKQAVWTAWVGGESYATMSANLQRSSSGAWRMVRAAGGIPRPARQRSRLALTLTEREVIARRVAAGDSGHEIAALLQRAPSTISREIARNGARTATSRRYDAATADARAWTAASRPKPCRLAAQPALCAVVEAQLAKEWSPAQIARRLVSDYPDDPTMRVSAETIYRSLYVQARGVLRKELTTHLRWGRTGRLPRGRGASAKRSRLIDPISIAARPPEVADRAVPGHWEGDLLAGHANSYIATLVERASRFVVLVKVPNKESASVVGALIRCARRLPAGLMTSLTWDRGTELARHRRFTVATDVAVYFCDPQSPWQRGSNENTNGLLRQYFPKGVELSQYSQAQLNAVAHRLNTRPRETLHFRTPAETLDAYLAAQVGASTG